MRWRKPAGLLLRLSAIGALVLISGSAVLLRERPRRLIEVEPGWLYRSGRLGPGVLRRTLERLEIDLIVDLTPDNGRRSAELAVARDLGVAWVGFPLEGNGTGAVSSYVGAVAAIDRAHRMGQRVLVHCQQGKARSAGAVAIYQTLVAGGSLRRPLEELQRFELARDSGVLAYMERHVAELARGLRARGVVIQPDAEQRMSQLRQLAGSATVRSAGDTGRSS